MRSGDSPDDKGGEAGLCLLSFARHDMRHAAVMETPGTTQVG